MKSLKYIVALALAAGLFQACDLERYPLTDLSEETFWNSESNAELALTSLYRGSLTDGVEYNPSDWWSYHGMIDIADTILPLNLCPLGIIIFL